MEVSGSPWYFLVWVVAYAVLNLWLPVVAESLLAFAQRAS